MEKFMLKAHELQAQGLTQKQIAEQLGRTDRTIRTWLKEMPRERKKTVRKSKLDEFAFLKNAKKLETIVFILFLIPGTPKDMLTYLVGTSPMRITQFLAISTFARIPSVISSTFIGSTIRQGEWEAAALIFVLTAVLGIVGIRHQERMVGFCKRISRRMKGAEHEEDHP